MPEISYIPDPRAGDTPASREFDCDCAGGSGGGSGGTSGGAGLMNGLINWWASEDDPSTAYGTWADRGSSNIPLTDVGAPSSDSAVGKFYHPVVLNGTTQYLLHADTPALRLINDGFTFSAWVFASADSTMTVFSKLQGSLNYEYALSRSAADDSINFAMDSAIGETFSVASAANSVPINTWALVVVWWEVGVGLSISVNDATPVGPTGPTGNDTVPTVEFRIGSRPDIGSFWNGKIEQICRWDRVLTAGERTLLMTKAPNQP